MSKNKRYTLEVFISLFEKVKRQNFKKEYLFKLLDVSPKETVIIKYEKNNEIYFNIMFPYITKRLHVKQTELTKLENKKIQNALKEVTVMNLETKINGNIIDVL